MNHESITTKGRIEIQISSLPFIERKLMQLAYAVGLFELGEYIRIKYGTLKSHSVIENLTMNVAPAVLAGLAGATGSQVAFTYLALGTDATAVAATQTALIAETVASGLARAAATVDRITTNVSKPNDTLRLRKTFTSNATVTIQECGYFNDPTTGVMGGRGLTGAKSLTPTDVFNLVYTIQFS